MTQFHPTEERLLVRPKTYDQPASGIIIPDQAQEKPVQGTVIEVGPDVPDGVKKGDEVMYSKYGGMEIELDGQTFLVLQISDVLGTLVNEG